MLTSWAEPREEGRRRTGPQQSDDCWKCGKLGHWANECRGGGGGRRDGGGYRRRSSSRDRRRSRSPYRGGRRGGSRSRSPDLGRSSELREGRCFICKEKGHIKRDCPELRGGRGPPRYDSRRDYGGRSYGREPRRYSRSRSPPRRSGGNRRDYTPSRSPPRRRDYSPRSRSPPRRYQRDMSRSPGYQ